MFKSNVRFAWATVTFLHICTVWYEALWFSEMESSNFDFFDLNLNFDLTQIWYPRPWPWSLQVFKNALSSARGQHYFLIAENGPRSWGMLEHARELANFWAKSFFFERSPEVCDFLSENLFFTRTFLRCVLGLEFFCVLGLEPCVLHSTSGDFIANIEA